MASPLVGDTGAYATVVGLLRMLDPLGGRGGAENLSPVLFALFCFQFVSVGLALGEIIDGIVNALLEEWHYGFTVVSSV